MSKTAVIQIRISPEDKERADALFDSCGLSTSAAIRLFIHQSLRNGKLTCNLDNLENKKFVRKNVYENK